MKNGYVLDRDSQIQLIQVVSVEEMYQNICDIDDMKALGYSDFSSCFFKEVWHVIGVDITTAIIYFLMLH